MDLVCNNRQKKKKTGDKSVLGRREYSDEQQKTDSCVPDE